MPRWIFLSLVTVVAGCALSNSNDGAAPVESDIATGTAVEPKSGTRLRALAWKRGTNVVATGAFKDTKLDTYCMFADTKDGSRCLPLGGDGPNAWANGYPLFLDATCTTPGLATQRAAGTNAHPKYARVTEQAPTTCGNTTSAVALGPATGQRNAFIKSGDRCVAWAVPDIYDDARSFTPIPNTDFVRGTADRVPVAADIAAGRVRGEDGSVSPYAIYDTRRDTLCYVDTDGHCLPSTAAYSDTYRFAEATCTDPAAYYSRAWGSGTGPDACRPRAIRAFDGCGYGKLFEVGSKVDKTYTKSGTQCVESTLDAASFDNYRLGQPIAIGSFPTATLVKQGGLMKTTMPTGAPLYTQFLDRSGTKACNPTTTPDGKVRCLPQADVNVGDFFGDAGCTQRVVEAPAPSTTCPTTSTYRFGLDYTKGQPYDLSATTRQSSVYMVQDGVCKQVRTSTVYDVTPSPLTNFDELTLSEESCHPTLGTCSETCTTDATCNGGFCSSNVCIAKIQDDQPIPAALGTCAPDVAKKVCVSGVCHDNKCGPKPPPSSSSSSSSGGASSSSSSSSGHTTAGDDDDSVEPPGSSSGQTTSGNPKKPGPRPPPTSGATTSGEEVTSAKNAPRDSGGGCNASGSSRSSGGSAFALLALLYFCRARTKRK